MKKHSFMTMVLLTSALALVSCSGKKTTSEEQTSSPATCVQQCNAETEQQGCGAAVQHTCQNAAQEEGCAAKAACAEACTETHNHQCCSQTEKASCADKASHECKNPEGCPSKKAMTPEQVFNKEYSVVAINGTKLEVAAEEQPTMAFDWAEKRVAGFAGCNRYFSQFEVGEGTLAFQQAGATKMACPNLALEDQFLAAFNKVKAYECTANGLRLLDENKTVVLLLSAK